MTSSVRDGFVRNSLADSRRWVPLTICAPVCFALSAVVVVSGQRRSTADSETSAAAVASDTATGFVRSDKPLFRLGDAARPFGWSTVIGDFNTDGKLDVAVADHVAGRANGYAYRLEFSISGQSPRAVTFESSHDAITISIADVDRDDDLDVIVGTPLSGEIVGIWLNDGHGLFTAGDVRQAPPTIRPLRSLGTTEPLVHVSAFELSSRRADDALPAVFQAALLGCDHRRNLCCRHIPRSSSLSAQANPRAPPSRVLMSCPDAVSGESTIH